MLQHGHYTNQEPSLDATNKNLILITQSSWSDTELILMETIGSLETHGDLTGEKMDSSKLKENPNQHVHLTLLLLMETHVLDKLNHKKYVECAEFYLIHHILWESETSEKSF